ncbi:hypothetical protein JOM56_005116 [Amanita muscaria]
MAHTDSTSPAPDSQDESEPLLSPRVQGIIEALKQPDLRTSKIVLKDIQRAASWFTLGIDPFTRLSKVLSIGFEHKITKDVTVSSAPNKNPGNKVEYLLELFERVLPLVDDFEEILQDFVDDAPQIELLFRFMTRRAQQERASDSASVKSAIHGYLPGRINLGDKKNRGFNHPIPARLLCPRQLLDRFDMDPEAFRNRVITNAIKVTSRHFPTFLYDEAVDYDPENKDIGLLQGHLLLAVYRHIFTGPKMALGGPYNPKAKPSKSQLHRRKGCDPYTIAYAAIQTYFALSSAEQWATMIGGFNLQQFYRQIVGLFEDDPEWATKTLEWWNSKVSFHGNSAYDDATSQTETDSGSDELEDIKDQRIRRAQVAQQRAETVSASNSNEQSASPTVQLTPPLQQSTPPTERSTPPPQQSTSPTVQSASPPQQSTPPTERSTPPPQQSDNPMSAFNMRAIEERLSELSDLGDEDDDDENSRAQKENDTRASKGRSTAKKRRAEEPPTDAPTKKKGKPAKSKGKTNTRSRKKSNA